MSEEINPNVVIPSSLMYVGDWSVCMRRKHQKFEVEMIEAAKAVQLMPGHVIT